MPSIDAPTFYHRATGIAAGRFDPFFRSLDPAIHADAETGSVESPLGHLLFVTVDDSLISPTGDERPPQGVYIVRTDDRGFVFGIEYGWNMDAARCDWADAEKVDAAYFDSLEFAL